MSTTGRLEGEVAVITGAASGIGAETARRFTAEGARVVICDLQEDAGAALQRDLGEATRFLRTDVSDEGDVAAAVDFAVAEFGRLDVMFNNAGIIGVVGRIADTPTEGWRRTLGVLLDGVFFGMKHAARVMRPQKSGSIISTASIAGLTAGVGPHGYTACKHAVVGLTKSVATELGGVGIRVNAIAPGYTVSAMTAATITGDPSQLDAAEEKIAKDTLLGIAGRPSDIAAAAVYLASADARFITGQTLVVDGGHMANGGSPDVHRIRPAVLSEAGKRE